MFSDGLESVISVGTPDVTVDMEVCFREKLFFGHGFNDLVVSVELGISSSSLVYAFKWLSSFVSRPIDPSCPLLVKVELLAGDKLRIVESAERIFRFSIIYFCC